MYDYFVQLNSAYPHHPTPFASLSSPDVYAFEVEVLLDKYTRLLPYLILLYLCTRIIWFMLYRSGLSGRVVVVTKCRHLAISARTGPALFGSVDDQAVSF